MNLKLSVGIAAIITLSGCSMTELEARSVLKAEAEKQITPACDCIKNATATDQTLLIEAESDCITEGQVALLQFSYDEGITDTYPVVKDEVMDYYFESVEACSTE